MAVRERLAFELAADERAATQARHRIVAAASGFLGDEDLETLGLLVSEVVTNAVLHGGYKGRVEIVAALGDDVVRVEVADEGEGFVPRPRALETDQVGGWGLFLVEQLASAWGVSFSGRTKVWFELACSSTPERA